MVGLVKVLLYMMKEFVFGNIITYEEYKNASVDSSKATQSSP